MLITRLLIASAFFLCLVVSGSSAAAQGQSQAPQAPTAFSITVDRGPGSVYFLGDPIRIAYAVPSYPASIAIYRDTVEGSTLLAYGVALGPGSIDRLVTAPTGPRNYRLVLLNGNIILGQTSVSVTVADRVTLVTPLFNRCVIFETTEHSWHAFDRIQLPPEREELSRRSIALYFYSRERPEAETAGRHTTHYVDGGLPAEWAPGRVLDASDLELLRELIAQRDARLRDLYAENSRLLQAQDAGFGGHLLYLAKRLYVRLGR